MQISTKILDKVEEMKLDLIPSDVNVEVTRNYGETASEKVSELMTHLLVAIIAVTILVMLAMGWRGGLVVFFLVPLTFSLIFFSYFLFGFIFTCVSFISFV